MTTRPERQTPPAWLLLAIPLAVLAACYVAVGVHAGTAWPWGRVVHEDGVTTLLGTVLDYRHALRELPLDVLLGLGVAGAVATARPVATGGRGRRTATRAAATAGAVLLSLAIVAGVWLEGGAGAVLDNVAQRPTRPGAPLEWGAHWRYHLVSRLSLLLVALGLGGLFAPSGRSWHRSRPAPAGLRLWGMSLLLFAAASVAFLPTLEPLGDPLHLGHQAREVVTHAVVTLPLAAWACLRLAGRGGARTEAVRAGETSLTTWAGAAGVLLAGYLGAAALLADAGAHAQAASLVPLVAVHFFEHTSSVLVTGLVAVAAYLSAAGPSPGTPAGTD